MRASVTVTTDFPAAEEVARRLGVSPERTDELIRLAETIASRTGASRNGKVSSRTTSRTTGSQRGTKANKIVRQ
jgi:hypothetical protein